MYYRRPIQSSTRESRKEYSSKYGKQPEDKNELIETPVRKKVKG